MNHLNLYSLFCHLQSKYIKHFLLFVALWVGASVVVHGQQSEHIKVEKLWAKRKEPKWLYIPLYMKDGWNVVKKGNRYGIVDLRGKQVLPIKYLSITQGRYLVLCQSPKKVEIYKDKKLVLKIPGLAKEMLLNDSGYSYDDTIRSEIAKLEYLAGNSKIAVFHIGETCYLIDTNGKMAFKTNEKILQHVDIDSLRRALFPIYNNRRLTVIDGTGDTILKDADSNRFRLRLVNLLRGYSFEYKLETRGVYYHWERQPNPIFYDYQRHKRIPPDSLIEKIYKSDFPSAYYYTRLKSLDGTHFSNQVLDTNLKVLFELPYGYIEIGNADNLIYSENGKYGIMKLHSGRKLVPAEFDRISFDGNCIVYEKDTQQFFSDTSCSFLYKAPHKSNQFWKPVYLVEGKIYEYLNDSVFGVYWGADSFKYENANSVPINLQITSGHKSNDQISDGNASTLQDTAIADVKGSFKDGLMIAFNRSKKCGYVDTFLHWVVPPQFCNCSQFYKGHAAVCQDEGSRGKVIGRRGNFLPTGGFSGYPVYENAFEIDINREYRYLKQQVILVDSNGRKLINDTFNYFNDISKTFMTAGNFDEIEFLFHLDSTGHFVKIDSSKNVRRVLRLKDRVLITMDFTPTRNRILEVDKLSEKITSFTFPKGDSSLEYYSALSNNSAIAFKLHENAFTLVDSNYIPKNKMDEFSGGEDFQIWKFHDSFVVVTDSQRIAFQSHFYYPVEYISSANILGVQSFYGEALYSFEKGKFLNRNVKDVYWNRESPFIIYKCSDEIGFLDMKGNLKVVIRNGKVHKME